MTRERARQARMSACQWFSGCAAKATHGASYAVDAGERSYGDTDGETITMLVCGRHARAWVHIIDIRKPERIAD